MRSSILFFTSLASLAGCANQEPRALAENHIRTLVFWHAFKVKPYAQPYFLSFDFLDSATGKLILSDPSDEFIRQFDGHSISVRKKSQARFLLSTGEMVDTLTGQKGYNLSIGPLWWKDNNVVRVNYSVTCGNLCGWGGVLTIQLTWRGWRITNEELRWVS